MKIKTTYNDRDLDFCYDVLIATTIAMMVIALIAKIAGVI